MFFNLSPMVKRLLLINLGVFLLQGFLEIDLIRLLGFRYIFADSFAPYQVFTYMFLHAGWGHIFSNMFALFIFGPMLERLWGPKRFLYFYLITGIGAGVLYGAINFFEIRSMQKDAEAYIEQPNPEAFNEFIIDHAGAQYNDFYNLIEEYSKNPGERKLENRTVQTVEYLYQRIANRPMVGASGAVFGILMAFGLLFPNVQLFLLFPPIPIKAKYLVLFYGLYELYAEINRSPGDNVAHYAHLGGMLIAFILLKIWQRKNGGFI